MQTVIGAVLTIVTATLVLLLFISELNQYMSIGMEDRMIPDSTVGVEDVAIKFDLSFDRTPCSRISFSQEGTKEIPKLSGICCFSFVSGADRGVPPKLYVFSGKERLHI